MAAHTSFVGCELTLPCTCNPSFITCKPLLLCCTSLLPFQQAVLSEALSQAGAVDTRAPVVFLHGIGGLPAYLELLLHLMAGGNPVLAVEVKSVAMRMG